MKKLQKKKKKNRKSISRLQHRFIGTFGHWTWQMVNEDVSREKQKINEFQMEETNETVLRFYTITLAESK